MQHPSMSYLSRDTEHKNLHLYNGKELQTDFDLNWYDYGARFYDVELVRWHVVDALAEKRNWLSPYNYVQNSPIMRVDPDGALDTWYIDKKGNVLMRTYDGSNKIVMVSNARLEDFKYYSTSYKCRGMKDRYDSKGWNYNWQLELGLYKYQLSDRQIANLGMLHSNWARENAIEYWLNPTCLNCLAFSCSEYFSQWTSPELITTGLSAGIVGLHSVRGIGRAAKGGSNMFGKTIQQTTTRIGRDGKAVEIIFKDGSKLDINSARVKQWIPKTHPKAPPGTLQKVKFPNPIPGTKGYKRLPTQQELEFLNGF